MPSIDPGILDSKRLQLFYAAAKEGGFAMAAHALNLTPSAVSHSVKTLEEELGCSLFRRSGPNIALTRSGARLLPMIEEVMTIMSRIKGEIASDSGRSENLSFTLSSKLLGIFNLGMLSVFRECFPASRLEIGINEQPDGRTNHDFHIGYANNHENFVRMDLIQEVFLACSSPFHPMAHQMHQKTFDLRHSLLLFSDPEIHARLMARSFPEGKQPRSWILPTPESVLDIARQGQGIAFLPNWIAMPSIRSGELVSLSTPALIEKRTCSAYWRPDAPLSWVAEAFLSLMVVEFEKRLGFTPD
ncbi:MAG: LysR family transcriptional regulator [Luteolibacter sp.]